MDWNTGRSGVSVCGMYMQPKLLRELSLPQLAITSPRPSPERSSLHRDHPASTNLLELRNGLQESQLPSIRQLRQVEKHIHFCLSRGRMNLLEVEESATQLRDEAGSVI
jgi:hypothetical protein